MRWRERRRTLTDEERLAARLRLAALTRRPGEPHPRTGWVPEVPASLAVPPVSTAEPPPGSGSGPGSARLAWLPLRFRAAAESIPDRVRVGRVGLEGGQAVVVLLVVLLGLAVAALFLFLGRPRAEPIAPGVSATIVATGTPASGPAGSESAESPGGDGPNRLIVHVAGKVRTPGVVTLPKGSRVLDAVDAAGGALDGVDLTGLNLARQVADGEQVLVGVTPPPGTDVAGGASNATADLVNLNTATSEQLDALPGIGPALAGRILAWREEHGRFGSVEELQEVSGIGPARFAELADLVTV